MHVNPVSLYRTLFSIYLFWQSCYNVTPLMKADFLQFQLEFKSELPKLYNILR